ncbi:TPA: hypothetical protein ACTXXA_003508 [Legionella anisa]
MAKTHQYIEDWNHGLYEPLKKTLEYAQKNIPYYSSRIKTINGKTIYELLSCVPLLDKETAIDHLQELRKEKIKQPGRISTGTLRKNKRFMDVQYIQAEDNAIQCFYQNNKSWSHAYDFDKLNLKTTEKDNFVVLKVINTHYEIPQYVSYPNSVSILWTTHANSFEIIKESLINLNLINIFEIESSTLIKLTIMLEQNGFDFKRVKVNTIVLHGFISAKWRDFIFSKWTCYISETFSLSEMRAKAYLCQNNQIPHFHFEPLPVVTEVLHPKTREQINSGAGLLSLTPLYPFAQQQMLLRYLTQDVVKIVPCNETNTLGFSWCGRNRDVVFLDELDLPHSSFGLREVIECLDKYYEIARSSDDFENLGLIEKGSVGWPLCKIEHTELNQHTILKLHIILIYPPNLFPDRTDELCKKIKIELISANDYLYENYEGDKVKVEVIPYPPSKINDLSGWHQNEFQKIVQNKTCNPPLK